MIKKTIQLSLFCCLIWSCNQSKINTEKGTLVKLEDFTTLLTDAKNNGKRFAIEADKTSISGNMVQIKDDNKVDVLFNKLLDHNPLTKMNIKMETTCDFFHAKLNFGQTKNSAYFPEQFMQEDVVLYDNDGKPHKYGEKVLISFTLKMDTTKKSTIIRNCSNPVEGYETTFEDIRIDAIQ